MKQRNYSLDILKFLATIFIIFSHYQQSFGIYFYDKINFFNGDFYWGYMVELFFILSGIFTYKYIDKITEETKLKNFFFKKYLRFLPLILITGLACLSFEIYNLIKYKISFPFSIFTTITSLLGITRWFTTNIMINNPIWYISVLLLCYILFFVVTKFAKKKNIPPNKFYIVIVFLSLIIRTVLMATNFSIPFISEYIMRGYSPFFLGLILAELYEKTYFQNKKITIIICLTAILSFVIFYYKIINWAFFPLCYLVFPAIITLLKNERIEKLFNIKILSCLGGISFNSFMWHVFVIKMLQFISSFYDIKIYNFSIMLITTIITLFIGLCSYFLIEKPISKLTKR